MDPVSIVAWWPLRHWSTPEMIHRKESLLELFFFCYFLVTLGPSSLSWCSFCSFALLGLGHGSSPTPTNLRNCDQEIIGFFTNLKKFSIYFLCLHPWHMEVPGPGMEPVPPQQSAAIGFLTHCATVGRYPGDNRIYRVLFFCTYIHFADRFFSFHLRICRQYTGWVALCPWAGAQGRVSPGHTASLQGDQRRR